MRRRRNTLPRAELMDAITAAAAAGNESEVARLSARAIREDHDSRLAAEPLDLPDVDR
jgi:hypothetical protein